MISEEFHATEQLYILQQIKVPKNITQANPTYSMEKLTRFISWVNSERIITPIMQCSTVPFGKITKWKHN